MDFCSAGRSFTGRKLFSARFTRAARRALRGARSVRLRVDAAARAGTGERRTVRRSFFPASLNVAVTAEVSPASNAGSARCLLLYATAPTNFRVE